MKTFIDNLKYRNGGKEGLLLLRDAIMYKEDKKPNVLEQSNIIFHTELKDDVSIFR